MAGQWLKALKNDESRGNRRGRQRLERYFDCTWMSPWGEQIARVSSLSANGCYVESRFTVPPDGTFVPEINLSLPSGPMTLQGTVINASPGIGFAVRFTGLDDDMRQMLGAVVRD